MAAAIGADRFREFLSSLRMGTLPLTFDLRDFAFDHPLLASGGFLSTSLIYARSRRSARFRSERRGALPSRLGKLIQPFSRLPQLVLP